MAIPNIPNYYYYYYYYYYYSYRSLYCFCLLAVSHKVISGKLNALNACSNLLAAGISAGALLLIDCIIMLSIFFRLLLYVICHDYGADESFCRI